MKKVFYAMAGLVLLMSGCDTGSKPQDQSIEQQLEESTSAGPQLSQEVVIDLIQSIPAPLEISMMIKESGTRYNKGMLNSTENIGSYNSNYKKALNLGIYGTDLGYTNIYSQSQDGVYYMNAVRDMADGLSIGQFFDFNTIKRLATNSNDLDSLLMITTSNFEKINSHLQNKNRSNLSILILTGGWLEALHLTCNVATTNKANPKLKEKIGEQKIVMERIMLLLSVYDNDSNIKSLRDDMLALQKAFNAIEIVYTYEESELQEIDGIMMMVDKSSSTVYITDEQLNNIADITNQIRNKIIKS
jgi:hypothetical protein